MKILGTFFRLLCALVVLLALAVLLDGSLQVSLVDYLAAFTPGHLMALFSGMTSWPVITAGALLLLTLCCGIRLGWNLVYSLATLTFFAGVALMLLGPELALPTCVRGLGWEQTARELTLNYPVPALLIPTLCILGCFCTSAPVRIAWTSLISLALCYGCAELLHMGVQQWQAMPEPFMPHALSVVETFPWICAALPAVFFVQFCLFMALFETYTPRRKKADKQKKSEGGKKGTPAQDEQKQENQPAPAATKTTTAAPAPVLVKRPVIHKKSPITPAPGETQKSEDKAPEETTTEKTEDTTPTEETATAEKTEDTTPTEETATAEKTEDTTPTEETATAEKTEDTTPTEETATAEKTEDTPATEETPATPIPSVPLPPAAHAAS